MSSFAKRLQELMDETGLKQHDIASRVGVTQSTISDWKNGKHEPRTLEIGALARIFGVEWAWLAKGKLPKYSEHLQEAPESEYRIGRLARARRVEQNVHAILQNADTQTFELFEGVVQPFARQVIADFERAGEPRKSGLIRIPATGNKPLDPAAAAATTRKKAARSTHSKDDQSSGNRK